MSAAINAIKHLGDVIALSSVYESEPFGVSDDDQPMYLNMVLSLSTTLCPKQLLAELLRIERENGRIRLHRNDSRTLDLDILMFGREVIESIELTVPHPRMHERAFVMLPLSEIAPDLVHPTLQLTMSEIADALLEQDANQVPNQVIKLVGTIDDLSGSMISPVAKPE